ncbi:MAG: PEGA domain-containing protein [Lachnospiraceae bacterium]|nr:PEGA domain-containing protein [Lachnospiraceae bacterium]
MIKKTNRRRTKYSGMPRACAILFAGLLLTGLLGGCGMISTDDIPSPVVGDETKDDLPAVYGPGSYDSADTPILIKKDEEKMTLTFFNLDVEKNYTLEYDGTTCFYDRHGSTVSLSQINPGDIVDVKFIKDKKHLTEMKLSPSAWAVSETDRYAIDEVKREVTIGEDVYKISKDAVYFSDGNRIAEQDIIPTDKLTFQGIGNKVYSFNVEKGHGYLRLTGHQGFIDGWIEIGNSVIQKVTEDMLITVPEGKYQVKISGSGTVAEKSVVINRNSESSLDFSDVEFAKPKTGKILFSLNPANAKLYVDGEQTNTSEAVELSYGLHQLICKAEGYTTITQYLNVGQPAAGIDITLEKSETEEKNDDTTSKTDSSSDQNTQNSGTAGNTSSGQTSGETAGNTDSGSSNTGSTSAGSTSSESENTGSDNTGSSTGATDAQTTSTYYKVYIDSPTGAEIYLDGSYVGISPCSFKKSEGLHVLTLSKAGYFTRSYTISVDGDDKDVSFSFADLVKEP